MSEQAKSPKKISKKKNEHTTISIVNTQKCRFKKYCYISWYYLIRATYFCILTSNASAVPDLEVVKTSMAIPVAKLIDDVAPIAAFCSAIFGAIAAKSQGGGTQTMIAAGMGLVMFGVLKGGAKALLGLDGVI